MPVLIAGIDEAGYGPMLGPLCVGLAVFRVRETPEPGRLPDLWKLLAKGVCKEPARGGAHDRLGRVAVADSKKLKLSNSVKTTHPLVHLERGVLSFVRAMWAGESGCPADDQALFEFLGAGLGNHPCYNVPARELPFCITAGELAIAASILTSAMANAGVELVSLGCRVIDEVQYNQIIDQTRNKAETTATAIGHHLRTAWDLLGQEDASTTMGIACDRLGGRAQYAGLLGRELEGVSVEVLEESDTRSRYALSGKDSQGRDRRAGASFLVEGETMHLSIALASMVAKFTRELAMLRFNQHWSGVRIAAAGGEIKPTAGYRNDAQRWLDEIGDVMSPEDRRLLVRWS